MTSHGPIRTKICTTTDDDGRGGGEGGPLNRTSISEDLEQIFGVSDSENNLPLPSTVVWIAKYVAFRTFSRNLVWTSEDGGGGVFQTDDVGQGGAKGCPKSQFLKGRL